MDLPNSHIASGVGLPVPGLDGASKPRGKTLRKLRVATCKVRSTTGRSGKLEETHRKRNVNIACVQETKGKSKIN